MEIKEVINQITSVPKWYALDSDDKLQVWLINTARRIKNGTSKRKTTEKFLKYFGYEIKTNVTKIK